MTARDDGLPNDPEGIRLMIHALVDGELDAAAALAVERRIAADPALAAEHARAVALQGAVSRLPRPQPSDAFMERIAAIGAAGEPERAPATERPVVAMPTPVSTARTTRSVRPGWSARKFGSFDWRAMAASIMVTAVLASGATQW